MNGETFQVTPHVIVSWGNLWTNSYVHIFKVLKEGNLILSENETPSKRNVRNVWLHSVIFFTKFDLHNTGFQSLFSQINSWELFPWSVRSYFSCKLLYVFNEKPFFCLDETSFFQSSVHSWLLPKKLKQKNGSLVLMWHIFQQTKIEINKI